MSADVKPEIPDIQVNYHHDFHFEVTLVHVSGISPEMQAAAVSMPLPRHSLSSVLALSPRLLASLFV